MRPLVSFVDDRALARNFKTGDVVQKTSLRDFVVSPYYGRVLFSNIETGVVVVQWPWGAEQEYPSSLNPVLDKDAKSILDLNQWYSNWDSATHGIYGEDDRDYQALSAKIASEFENKTLPVWRSACECMNNDLNEFETFKSLSSDFGSNFSSDVIRITVSNLYETAKRLSVYWHDSKRRYKVTKKEKDLGKYICPRCKSMLKPRIFRQNQRVLACKTCGFTIHPRDLVSNK